MALRFTAYKNLSLFNSEYTIILGSSHVDIRTAIEVVTMVKCLGVLDTISYGGKTKTTRRWKCPSGSTGRYVYLLFEDTISSPKLGEVEVYAPSTAPSSMPSGGEYVTWMRLMCMHPLRRPVQCRVAVSMSHVLRTQAEFIQHEYIQYCYSSGIHKYVNI